MTRARLHRRSVLRGAGGVAVALPLLEAMLPRRAYAAPPRRLAVFFTPNGTIRENWLPTGGMSDFVLGPILRPLEPHRGDIVVIDGVDQMQSGLDVHIRGMACMLTGMPPAANGPWNGDGFATGPSVDQVVANAFKGATPLPSLELGVGVGAPAARPPFSPVTAFTRMVYTGSNAPLTPENSPYAAFDRLFAPMTARSPAAAQAAARRRADRMSVLDALSDDYRDLVARVGGEDKQRLDAHLQALRDLEQALASPGIDPTGPVCAPPSVGATLDVNATTNFPTILKLQMDLMTRAFACDLTRVATLQWSHSVSELVLSWLGLTDQHHELSHHGDSDAAAKTKLTTINTWFAQQFAYLVDKLGQEKDATGASLLDSVALLWCNELAKGNIHAGDNALYVVAGRAGGAIRTGRFLKFDGRVPHNNLLLSLVRAMGVDAQTFGNPQWCTGPLTGLLT